MVTIIHTYPLTKEEKILLCYFFSAGLKILSETEKYDEELFKKLYEKEYLRFLDDQTANIAYCKSGLKQFNRLIKNPFTPAKIKKSNKCLKSQLTHNFFYLFDGNRLKMDIQKSELKKVFENNFFNLIEELKVILPQKLLNNIPDLRVFCLGYTTTKNLKLFKSLFEQIIEKLKN